MSVGIEQLRKRITRSSALAFITDQLGAFGFTAHSWAQDAKQSQFIRAFATVWADQSETVRQVVHSAINDYATGTPLTELTRSQFGNERHPAKKTIGPYKLTNTGATPYTLQPGQLVLESSSGVQFVSTTGGTLPAAVAGPASPPPPPPPPITVVTEGPFGPTTTTIPVPAPPPTPPPKTPGELVVTIQSLKAGGRGNVPNGSITRFITPLAGVTGTNEAGAGDAPWYTTSGADEESVPATRERNRTRITTLNQISLPSEAYKFIAMSVQGIERVKVDDTNPRGPGTIDVYIATASGAATENDRRAVQLLIDAKRSPNDDVKVLTPSNVALNPAGLIHLSPGFATKKRKNEVLEAMLDYVNSLAIGGVRLPPATSGVMPRSELVTAVSQLTGVFNVNFTTPSADVPLAALQLLVPGDISGIRFQPEPTV